MNLFHRIKTWVKQLPNKKHHLDFIAALLSIPVLLTVVTTNIINLQNKSKPQETTTKQEKPIIIQNQDQPKFTPKATDATPSVCKKEVGPISISYPEENQTVSDNPVCITIKYDNTNYCSVVWSYRINGGSWSNYSSNSVCLYNVPKGNVKFELRAQSTVSEDQTSITRNFVNEGSNSVPTPTLSSGSDSATLR